MSAAAAPGKIILFGEHSVVYGRPAIAVPVLDVTATAAFTPAANGSGLHIFAPDLGRSFALQAAPPDDPLATIVQNTLAHLGQSPPDGTLTVSSTIPLGRGLGSGAAIAAAAARAVAGHFGQSLPPAELSTLVFEVEKLYHGTPSGIDNTVIAFAQPVYFIKGKPIQRLRVARPFTVVIGDTGVSAATREVVGDLRRRRDAEPHKYEGYFDEIAVIARHAKMIVEQEVTPLAALGKLMNENHEILTTLGISSPELEQLVAAARQAGAWGAKLSGAGWGGNMIALSPPEPTAVEAIAQALTAAGATGVIISQVSPKN